MIQVKRENKKATKVKAQSKKIETLAAIGKKAVWFLDRHFVWVLFAVFLLVFFPILGTQSLDSQDGSYWGVSQKGIVEIATDNFGDQLPVWFVLLKAFTFVFSSSEWALRIFVLVFLLASLLVLQRLCRLFEASEKICLALFLFNPLTVQIAFLVKHFTFLIFVSLCALWIFEKLRTESNQKKWLGLFALAVFLGLYSNLIFLVFLGCLAIYAFFLLARKKLGRKKALVLGIIVVLLLVPLAVFFAGKAEKHLTESQSPQKRDAEHKYSEFVFSGINEITGAGALKEWKTALLLALLLLALFSIMEWKNNQKHFWFFIFVLIPFIFFLWAMKYSAVRWRYLSILVPFAYLLVIPRPSNRFIAAVSLVALVLTGWAAYSFASTAQIPDWRGASRFVANQLEQEQGQLVFIAGYDYYEIAQYYTGIPPEQATIVSDFKDVSIIRQPNVWIIRHSGEFDQVGLLRNIYIIREFSQFNGIKVFHLTKKAGQGSATEKSILLGKEKTALITTNGKTQTCLFENNAIQKDCFEKDWQEIKEIIMASGKKVRNCLYVHPRTNRPIEIVVPNALLDKSLKIVSAIEEGYVDKDKAPIFADVFIDNQFIGRSIQPDLDGWFSKQLDTQKWNGKKAEVRIQVTSDFEQRRHYCLDAQTSAQAVPSSVLDLLDQARVFVGSKPCNLWKTIGIWPHNEQKPPFKDSKILERWDCEKNLVEKQQIWKTVGKSFAISGHAFQQAIWAHPHTGEVLRITFDHIDANGLNGFFGLNDLAIAKKANAQIGFKILANNETILDQNFFASPGWKGFDLPGVFLQKGTIEFQITTTNQNWNHFFFNAFLETGEK